MLHTHRAQRAEHSAAHLVLPQLDPADRPHIAWQSNTRLRKRARRKRARRSRRTMAVELFVVQLENRPGRLQLFLRRPDGSALGHAGDCMPHAAARAAGSARRRVQTFAG